MNFFLFFLGLRRFVRDIHFMLDRTMGFYWKFCWGLAIPVALIAMFFYQATKKYS